jgi:hypothetical protein
MNTYGLNNDQHLVPCSISPPDRHIVTTYILHRDEQSARYPVGVCCACHSVLTPCDAISKSALCSGLLLPLVAYLGTCFNLILAWLRSRWECQGTDRHENGKDDVELHSVRCWCC